MAKILITGASGLLGGKLLHHFASDAQGWSFRKTRPHLVSVDIIDAAQVRGAFASAGPQVCIHCAAEANVNTCEANPARSSHLSLFVLTPAAHLWHYIMNWKFKTGSR